MPRDPLSPAVLREAAAHAAHVPVPAPAPRSAPRLSIGGQISGWWRALRRRREERLHASALGALSRHLIRDIDASDELRLRALAHRESQIERLARTSLDSHGGTGRFGL